MLDTQNVRIIMVEDFNTVGSLFLPFTHARTRVFSDRITGWRDCNTRMDTL
jgi:hypothetical protein